MTEVTITSRDGRRIVLKRLDDDCLLDGQLHPMIRQRLERVRELPLTAVANLLGVERIDGVAQLVWEHVPGTPLASLKCDPQGWLRVTREVILAVQALHAAGIVHGALHERNVIVEEPTGRIKLTHVSPLLYSEVEQDAADVVAMLDDLVAQQEPDSPLSSVLAEARLQQWPLGVLYGRLAELDERSPAPPSGDADEPSVRIRALVAAAVVAIVGMALAVGLVWYVNDSPFAS